MPVSRSFASVLVVGDVFQPISVLAVDHVRDRDVAHAVGRCRSMPMLHTRRGPDDIAWLNLSLLPSLLLHPPCPGSDNQVLTARMRVPGRACSRLEGDKGSG